MSIVMSQQLPKDDEEEEDEEQGEEFVFEDSDDDEEPQKEIKEIDSVPVRSPESVASEPTDRVTQTGTNGIELQRRSPPAGQEVPGAIFIEGNIFVFNRNVSSAESTALVLFCWLMCDEA